MAKQVLEARGSIGKAEDDLSGVDRMLSAIEFSGWTVLTDDVEGILERIAKDGSAQALIQIGIDDADITEQANERAIEWARQRAAELVGMRRDDDGELVPNPDAQWRIDETTRDSVRGLVQKAEDEGWSNDELSKAIKDSAAFSDSRAETVARTETAFADTNGNLEAYRASGEVEGKEWVLAEEPCDECEANAAQGVVPLDDEFESGDDAPPAHPNCECDFLPVLRADDNEG